MFIMWGARVFFNVASVYMGRSRLAMLRRFVIYFARPPGWRGELGLVCGCDAARLIPTRLAVVWRSCFTGLCNHSALIQGQSRIVPRKAHSCKQISVCAPSVCAAVRWLDEPRRGGATQCVDATWSEMWPEFEETNCRGSSPVPIVSFIVKRLSAQPFACICPILVQDGVARPKRTLSASSLVNRDICMPPFPLKLTSGSCI